MILSLKRNNFKLFFCFSLCFRSISIFFFTCPINWRRRFLCHRFSTWTVGITAIILQHEGLLAHIPCTYWVHALTIYWLVGCKDGYSPSFAAPFFNNIIWAWCFPAYLSLNNYKEESVINPLTYRSYFGPECCPIHGLKQKILKSI